MKEVLAQLVGILTLFVESVQSQQVLVLPVLTANLDCQVLVLDPPELGKLDGLLADEERGAIRAFFVVCPAVLLYVLQDF